ncbi:uncharacterized protein LOC118210181 isoform X2 [Anguilla anguilla]|uniref:uncharacterized protein LOC118210181 isoform X2 n=1 Tax=Anguilla anguilla TaxID=7936 RepID=UPI0015AF5F4D|nr:uncharacterized protein LOC118210181 isoform X2 [Anguilla anguilla]
MSCHNFYLFFSPISTDNEQTLFNIHCKISVLLDSIKSHCHCEYEEIDLVDENAELKNLLEQRDEYASQALRGREEYALVSVRRCEDSSQPLYTLLLQDQAPLHSTFIAKLRNKEGSRALGIQPQRKRTKRKSTLPQPQWKVWFRYCSCSCAMKREGGQE